MVTSPSYAFDKTETQVSVIQPVEQTFSEAELAQMLAPIALYPDTLLTHILIAATYPIEVIDADRFLKKNQGLSTQEIVDKATNKDWDPSVKALLSFPRIVEKLSEDLGWMRKLGDAFLQDEAQVLASIQTLRRQADEAGHLPRMENVEIVRENKTIVIEPAQPDIIYVPYYDTRVVYGNWHWSHYPPVYWHSPVHYSYYNGPFYWHSGVHLAFDFFFTAFHWHNHHVVRHYGEPRHYHTNRRIATSHEAKRWHHNPAHRRGVAYRNNEMKHRYTSSRPSVSHSRSERKQYQNAVLVTGKGHQAKKHDDRDKPFVSTKHQQLNERLKTNRAIKLPSKAVKNSTVDNSHKEKFHVAPGRIHQQKLVKQATSTKQKHNVDNVSSYDSWKPQQRVKMVEQARPKGELLNEKQVRNINRGEQMSQVKVSRDHNKEYRAQGSHSNKQSRRVTNNSSHSNESSSKRRHKDH